MKKIAGLIWPVFMLFAVLSSSLTVSADEPAPKENAARQDGTAVLHENTYEEYIKQFSDMNSETSAKPVKIPAAGFSKNSGAELSPCPDMDGAVFLENASGAVTWEFPVETSGLYTISVLYKAVDDRRSDFQITGQIDGKLIFKELSMMTLRRMWAQSSDIDADENGNDMRPELAESKEWYSDFFKSADGMYSKPFCFYFESGVHSVTIETESRQLALASLTVAPYQTLKSYEEYMEENQAVKKYDGEAVFYELEEPFLRNSANILAQSDMSSPYTTPYSAAKIKLNTFGGVNWKYAGQKAAWMITVPEDGLYKLTLRYRQNFVAGMNVYRTLYVNDEIPFEEAGHLAFSYGTGWRTSDIGGYFIKLNKGENKITLEATLGTIAEPVRKLQGFLLEANELYRQIIMVTGTTPDRYRDYELEKEIPGLAERFKSNAQSLNGLISELEAESGISGSEIAVLRELERQFTGASEKLYILTKSNRLDRIKSNISSLGAMIGKLKEQPLELDSLKAGAADMEAQPAAAGFWDEVVHRVKRFCASFTEDYGKTGAGRDGRQIQVWLYGMGRDQMQIVKNLLDDGFTAQKNISVNLQLVQASVVQAVFSGKAPDVILGCGENDPVNYAMRGILYDLSQFDDFEKVTGWFTPGSMIPFKYQGGYFGLPQTQAFDMMFYRKDVFADLGLTPPHTWDELTREVLPVLLRNNMQAGVGQLSPAIFKTLLYQMGGSLYKNDLSGTNLDTAVAFASFQKAVDFYVDYKLPKAYDPLNRFRTGEMPLVINSYTFCNNLAVGAPELAGLWEMMLIPGIENDNGEISRSQIMSSTGGVKIKGTKSPDASWEFLKWWSGADTQTRFGLDQEALLGASGRYSPANMDALENLPWSAVQMELLEKQRGYCTALPELPGSYFTNKGLSNAFLNCVLKQQNSREALIYWSEEIDVELARKRKEYNFIPEAQP